MDTEAPLNLRIPPALRSTGDPGAYIAQCRGPLDQSFRDHLTQLGASIVSYNPNHAYLVCAGRHAADELRRSPRLQALIPYEPYYKITPSLLRWLLAPEAAGGPGAEQEGVVRNETGLSLLIFPGADADVEIELRGRGLAVQARSSSPFGPVFTLSCSRELVPSLAQMPGVELLELARRPLPAMDLARAASGIAPSSVSALNYLGLSLAGQESIFRKIEPLLRTLADNLDYKGEPIGLASTWEMIYIMHYYGMFLSLFHSVQICQAEGIPLEQYSALLGKQGKNYEKWLCENILSGNYQETSAPLELWAGGIQHIVEHAEASNIRAEFPKLTARLFQDAMNAGYGREEVSALFKVLQRPL